jgi:anti-sigma-K factor RskA
MSSLSNEQLETAAAYALGALDADEAAAFALVLALSPELQREVESLREATGMLGAATAPVAPSPGLKQSVMAQLAATPQLPREDAGAQIAAHAAPVDPAQLAPAHTLAGAEPATETPAPIPMSGLAADKARMRWFARPATIVAAAAAAVVLFFAGAFAADLVRPSSVNQQVLAQVVAAPDATVASSEVAGGATASLVSSESLGLSVMVFDGLATLSDDEAYALWYITGDQISPAGLFTVDADGQTVQVLEGEFVAGTIVGVTVEPASGSPQPTSDPIVAIVTESA